jgi:hypothetical protein
MKKFLAILALSMISMFSYAEATFDQIEGLIQQKNYQAAESGLEVIIKNHPQSAKAFYAMAQAQAGLGNLDKAQKALNIATGLNPTLDFAPEGSVRKLKEAITPQTAKIEQIEESHTTRNVMIVLLLVVTGFAGWYGYKEIQRKREEEEAELSEKLAAQAELDRVLREQNAKEVAARATTRAKSSAATETKTDATKNTASIATSGPAVPQPMYTPQPAVQPTHTTTVVNNGSNNDLLTTMVVMDMLSDHHHHHDTTRVVEREVIREVPAPRSSSSWDDNNVHESKSSSWDDTPSTNSRSSSWDSDSSSSSRSSSWDSTSSSSSSSSWDSGSSSSDSSSSSSWD